MANNQPCVTGTESACEALVRIINRAMGGPFPGTRAGAGGRLSVPSTWNGMGNAPPGWTTKYTCTWFTGSTFRVPISTALQTTLAGATAQNRLTPADKAILNASLAALATIDISTHTPKPLATPAYPYIKNDTIITAWDAWVSNHTTLQTTFGGTASSPGNIYADYPHRFPDFAVNGTDQFNVPGDPTVDSQTFVDTRLQLLSGAVECISYNLYPDPSCFGGDPANIPTQGYITTTINCHRASAYKNLVKAMVMIDPNWWSHDTMPLSLPGGWGHATSYKDWLVTFIQESCYYRFNGRPVIGLFNYASLSAGNKTTFLAQLDAINTAVTSAIGVAPYYLVQDYNSSTATDTISKGARWKSVYGPNPVLSGTVQVAYSQEVAWDQATWASSGGGLALACSVVALQDRRAKSAGATAYADSPTILELAEHLNQAYCHTQTSIGKSELTVISSLSEYAESGGFERTTQNGTKYYDACKLARLVSSPSTLTDRADAHYLSWTKTGAGWSYVQSVIGAYDSDLMRTSTTNDKLEYSAYQCTQFRFYTSKGPDKGILNIYLDGVLQTTVDLYAASTSHMNLVWTSPVLMAGLHTFGAECSGTKNASSSAVTVDVDMIEWTVSFV